MKPFIYLILWFLRAKFAGRKRPLQTVLFVSNQCNLKCRHCCVYRDNNLYIKTFEQIKEELQYSYDLGARFVDFEGGEPFLWNENGKNINDLIRLAKQIGFFSTTVTTNAQQPFNQCDADSIWVSLDGIGTYHDQIRGEGTFDRLVENLAQNNHPKISINMVINALNYKSVEETIVWASKQPNIQSISLNFHTPYPETEDLFLDWKLRTETIDKIIQLKKANFPVMNSVSGLKLMKGNRFKKYCWLTNFILPDGTRLNECQGKTQNVCDKCGFCMAGETTSLFRLKADTVFAALKLRMKR
ncbi:MAG: radical SAM protein [Lentimicrobiaceae bacterium]|nr:radical SAM protein [Lentimicrobiaceae bacterium]